MSIPSNVVIKVSAANSIPPVIKVDNKTFRTEVK
jgi:hypothetical protein